jgi:fructokinase
MKNLYILGETTFDIIFKYQKPLDAKVGGSQLNTAISAGRLGLPVYFISQFGSDKTGDISLEFMKKNGINTRYVHRNEGNSRLALAFLDEENNAEYNFYEGVSYVEKPLPVVNRYDLILFGSSFALRSDVRDGIIDFLNSANKNGATIIYDPNYRKSNSALLSKQKPYIEENMMLSTIVKGSDEDFKSIFNTNSAAAVWNKVKSYGIKGLVYTANKNGVNVYNQTQSLFYRVPEINPVSTIGAGDAFNAGLLFSFYRHQINETNAGQISADKWDSIIQTAIKFAQHVCMHYDNYISQDFADNYQKQPGN